MEGRRNRASAKEVHCSVPAGTSPLRSAQNCRVDRKEKKTLQFGHQPKRTVLLSGQTNWPERTCPCSAGRAKHGPCMSSCHGFVLLGLRLGFLFSVCARGLSVWRWCFFLFFLKRSLLLGDSRDECFLRDRPVMGKRKRSVNRNKEERKQ